jgi:hypothetical protein
VVLEPHAPPRLDEVLPAHAAELRVVPNQIRELPALMDKVAAAQPVDLFFEAPDAEQVREHGARVVETERLVEVRRQQIVFDAVEFVHTHEVNDISAFVRWQSESHGV